MVSALLAVALGTTGLAVGIVAAVTNSSALAIVAGVVALALALLCTWLLKLRRDAANRIDVLNADVARLETALTEAEEVRAESDQAAKSEEKTVPTTPQEKTSEVRKAAEIAGLSRVSEALASSESTGDLTDARTGLLGEKYFRVTLDGRVASARRHLRPLALILLDVIEGASHEDPKHADPVRVGDIAQSTLRDADTLCRLDDGRFAMILEDTPENGAIWTVERIRRRINEEFTDTTAWAGVACYPAHGFDGAEVLAQARKAITSARDWRQDRTEVADS